MFETNAPPPIPTNNIITISSPTGDGPAARNIVSRMVPTASPADPILFKASAPPLWAIRRNRSPVSVGSREA